MAQKQNNLISRVCYRIIRALVKLFYPRTKVVGAERLPDGPCVVVGNHAQMNGPIVGELYFPGPRYIWCAGEMMHLREVPDYAFQDFWSGKPRSVRWFFRLFSYLIAPISVCVFTNARTIGVYRGMRVRETFRETVARLEQGANVIIFPESYTPHNRIVYEFQTGFVDVARLYAQRTGRALPFVPLYLAPRLRTACIGEPVYYRPDAAARDERERICGELMDRITALAEALPVHTVVPYPNMPKRDYPASRAAEAEP